jgi:glutamyl-Q tRNA(Asp) synthetase
VTTAVPLSNSCIPGGVVGRFAPSPTGTLHTGSLVAAVGSWLMAKSAAGRWLLRMDDLDTPRQVSGMADDILRTLEDFGLEWDGEVTWQSRHRDAYRQAFEQLQQQGVIYPCCCSRKEIAQTASAPRPDDDTVPYPGTCRDGMLPGAQVRSWRVRVTDAELCFEDHRRGRICQDLSQGCGDFALRRGDGEFAYQLAVVVDDALTGVNQVVRGDDLLASTPRQIYLQRLLGLPQPQYCHLPLVTGPGGEKLSKRENLVSHGLGGWKGREGIQLWDVLAFLGQMPPQGMRGASCGELLQWSSTHFDMVRIPLNGGELRFS